MSCNDTPLLVHVLHSNQKAAGVQSWRNDSQAQAMQHCGTHDGHVHATLCDEGILDAGIITLQVCILLYVS